MLIAGRFGLSQSNFKKCPPNAFKGKIGFEQRFEPLVMEANKPNFSSAQFVFCATIELTN